MAAPMKKFVFVTYKSPFSVALKSVTVPRKCQTSAKKTTKSKDAGDVPSFPPDKLYNDWIGPPDKVSNIRKMKFYIPENETSIEKDYREKREAVQQWHHEFWTAHNKSFFTEKEEFIKQRLMAQESDGESKDESISPEELSVFYKQFLDDNYRIHMNYNKEWYKKNISLLWPAFKVNIIRLLAANRKPKTNT